MSHAVNLGGEPWSVTPLPPAHRYRGQPYAWIIPGAVGHTIEHGAQIRQFITSAISMQDADLRRTTRIAAPPKQRVSAKIRALTMNSALTLLSINLTLCCAKAR